MKQFLGFDLVIKVKRIFREMCVKFKPNKTNLHLAENMK